MRFNWLFIAPTRTYKEQKKAETAEDKEANKKAEDKEANKKAEDKEANKKAEDKERKGRDKDKDKRDLDIPPQVLLIPANQTPLIRKIPRQARRDNPKMDNPKMDRNDNTGRDTDMGNHTNDQGKHDHKQKRHDHNLGTHAAIVLELGQPLLKKLKPQ